MREVSHQDYKQLRKKVLQPQKEIMAGSHEIYYSIAEEDGGYSAQGHFE